ncbi:MAG: hypothetical protein MRK02_12085 [Candidatus Scalindua sp.]|nr:hypothetical protein [Candidatus Scalindua sp.]
MVKRNLVIITCRWSIYIGIFFFFFASILGYASHVSIDTLVKKSVIVGCLFSSVFFVMMRILTRLIPDSIFKENEKQSGNGNDSQEQTTVDSS